MGEQIFIHGIIPLSGRFASTRRRFDPRPQARNVGRFDQYRAIGRHWFIGIDFAR